MLAFSYSEYGSPDVIEQVTLPQPTPNRDEVLIRIHATTVSAGDWRARSLTMPKGLGFMERLVFGISGPRQPLSRPDRQNGNWARRLGWSGLSWSGLTRGLTRSGWTVGCVGPRDDETTRVMGRAPYFNSNYNGTYKYNPIGILYL